MKISLNIFTNCTSYAPSTDIIENTYSSFVDVFGGNYETIIFIDSHPNMNVCEKYKNNIINKFPKSKVVRTNSLSDGYIKAVKQSDSDYMFMLEHDWQFNKPLIKHSLEEICEIMQKNNIYHLRFNKRQNIKAGWDTQFTPTDVNGFKCCISNNMSNNPHIIDRKKYINEMIKYLKILPGSKGIEEELNKTEKYFSYIYGPENYPATVTHLDGRRDDKVRRVKKGRR
ncbi:MAG TPA: hypothetical protein PKG96_09780 [Bacilli bacterium]|nr:hypothetical protein [Bacilli bacterium]